MKLKEPMYHWSQRKEVATDPETYQIDEERTNILRHMEANFKAYSPEEEVCFATPQTPVVRVPHSRKKGADREKKERS